MDWLAKYNIPHHISAKQATVGRSGALLERYNIETNQKGINASQEVKMLIAKDIDKILYVVTPSDYKLNRSNIKNIDISKYGVVPYTVNPGTLYHMIIPELIKKGKEVSIVANPSLNTDGIFYTNHGSRLTSVAFTGKDLYNAIKTESDSLNLPFISSLEHFVTN